MGRPLILVGLIALMMATGVALAGPGDTLRLPITLAPEAPPMATQDSVVVVSGDHLWKISERHIDSNAPGRKVAPYWVEVIDVNTPNLRSGDPDLIYPGEVIVLPPLSEQP